VIYMLFVSKSKYQICKWEFSNVGNVGAKCSERKYLPYGLTGKCPSLREIRLWGHRSRYNTGDP
jgi:hypothetical protein